MNLINRETDYAVRILKFMSRHSKRAYDTRVLSERLGIPRPFLRKILQRLGNEGLLVSSRGRNGGFSLGRSPGRIFINDLLLLFQESKGLVHCDRSTVPCGARDRCLLNKKLKILERRFLKEIGTVSILRLLEAEG
jgi:Rrf2 family iron-responsive transcriptional regulator